MLIVYIWKTDYNLYRIIFRLIPVLNFRKIGDKFC